MSFPHPPGLTPPEIAFICEMELVTIVPRQRLERLDLLGVSGPAPLAFARLKGGSTSKVERSLYLYFALQGPTPALLPPQRSLLPLWLALLLKRQRRANIIPPQWLHPDSLSEVLEL